MQISSTDDFVAAVNDVSPDLESSIADPEPWQKEVSWGPPTSMEGQDALSRLGVETGAPTAKAAFYKKASAGEVDQLVKEALIGAAAGWAARGLSKLAPKLLSGGAKAAKGAGRLAKKTPGALARGWRRQVPRGSVAATTAGVGTEAGFVGNDLNRAFTHSF